MQTAFKALLAALVPVLAMSVCNADELPARSQEDANGAWRGFNLWINPGIMSYHFNRSAGYREKNWGFGVQSDLPENLSVLAGNYINSDYARSNYAGVAWQPLSWHAVRLGLYGGLLDGYPAMRNGGVFAVLMPWASIRNDRFGVNLTIVPNYRNRLHGAIAAQFILRVW